MAAHTYWAIRAAGKSSGLAIAELQFRATPGGASIATGGTAAATASNTGYEAANAFDGSATTAWSFTGAGTQRLQYQWASPVDVAEVYIRLPGAAFARPPAGWGPSLIWVEWSDDGSTFYVGDGMVWPVNLGNDGELAWTVSDAPPTGMVLGAEAWSHQHWPWGGTVAVREDGWTFDHIHGGAYRLAGTVKIDGTPTEPVRRRVRVFNEHTGRLAAEVWSDAVTGEWAVEGLALARYLVVTDDYTALYDPVARSQVLSVP